MRYCLCIIDMQATFEASMEPSIKTPILREIELAKKNNQNIIIVEYTSICYNYKPTFDWITSAIGTYKKSQLVLKCNDSGSHEVNAALKAKLIKTRNIRVVGVNTEQCVCDTAVGLAKLGYNVHCVQDACASDSDHEYGIRVMNKNKVKVMRQGKTLAA